MAAQARGDRIPGREEAGVDARPRLKDRVVRCDGVERDRSVIGVNRGRDAAANGIDRPAVRCQRILDRDGLGVGIPVRDRHGVRDPEKPAVDDGEIRVTIEQQEGSDRVKAFRDGTNEEDAAFGGEDVGEQDSAVAEPDRESDPAKQGSDSDSALAVVDRPGVAVTKRIIEFFHRRADEDVRSGFLPVVDLRPVDGKRNRNLRRDVPDPQFRLSSRGDLRHRVHDDAEPVRELKACVDPRSRLKLLQVELPRGQHDLAARAADRVAVHIHLVEVVIRPDFLELLVAPEQRSFVPDADVAEGFRLARQIVPGDRRRRDDRLRLHRIQAVGLQRRGDAALDIGSFPGELVGFDDEALDERREDSHRDDVNGEDRSCENEKQFLPLARRQREDDGGGP